MSQWCRTPQGLAYSKEAMDSILAVPDESIHARSLSRWWPSEGVHVLNCGMVGNGSLAGPQARS